MKKMSGGTFLTHTVNLSPRSVRVSAHLWFVRRCCRLLNQ